MSWLQTYDGKFSIIYEKRERICPTPMKYCIDQYWGIWFLIPDAGDKEAFTPSNSGLRLSSPKHQLLANLLLNRHVCPRPRSLDSVRFSIPGLVTKCRNARVRLLSFIRWHTTRRRPVFNNKCWMVSRKISSTPKTSNLCYNVEVLKKQGQEWI